MREDHAWFVAFAPYEAPQIAVAVFVEHGGGGSHVAAPVARQMMRAWFKRHPYKPSGAPLPAMAPHHDDRPWGPTALPAPRPGSAP